MQAFAEDVGVAHLPPGSALGKKSSRPRHPRANPTTARAWLKKNDPTTRKEQKRRKRQRARAAAQASTNPQLVARYHRGLRPKR